MKKGYNSSAAVENGAEAILLEADTGAMNEVISSIGTFVKDLWFSREKKQAIH